MTAFLLFSYVSSKKLVGFNFELWIKLCTSPKQHIGFAYAHFASFKGNDFCTRISVVGFSPKKVEAMHVPKNVRFVSQMLRESMDDALCLKMRGSHCTMSPLQKAIVHTH